MKSFIPLIKGVIVLGVIGGGLLGVLLVTNIVSAETTKATLIMFLEVLAILTAVCGAILLIAKQK